MEHHALHNRITELAADVGRLRRCLDPETSLAWKAARIADHVEAIFWMVEPRAAQLAACTAPGDPDAINEAIRIVDQRHRQLQTRLGTRQ